MDKKTGEVKTIEKYVMLNLNNKYLLAHCAVSCYSVINFSNNM